MQTLVAVVKLNMRFCRSQLLKAGKGRTVVLITTTTGRGLLLECLPRDGHVWKAEAAAAARPRSDPEFVFPRSLQESLVAAHLLQHQDQELEHHNGKVAAER